MNEQIKPSLGPDDAPFSIAPLGGKYYGTIILDSDGVQFLRVWGSGHGRRSKPPRPSRRMKEKGEIYEDMFCDSHWESEQDLEIAESLVEFLNHKFATGPSKEML